MWVVAYGLDLVDKWMKNGTTISECEAYAGELVSLHHFNYTNEKMGCYLRRGFHEVNILGITVSCSSLQCFKAALSSRGCTCFNRDLWNSGRTVLDLIMSWDLDKTEWNNRKVRTYHNSFVLNCVHIICCTLATYTVTRPTVARVTNRGGVGDMVSDTYDSVLFTNGESESTVWPGTHMIHTHTNIITLSR